MPSQDPFDDGYNRLQYCRYGDDFAIGVIGSKEDAKEVYRQVKAFVETELLLPIAEQKSGIYHAREGIEYLGYLVRVETTDKVMKVYSHGRYTMAQTVSGRVRLRVPPDKVRAFCRSHGYGDYHRKRTRHKPEWLQRSEEEIILAYNAEFRGLVTYYSLASDVKQKLHLLEWLWQTSLLKTLANKHRTTIGKIVRRMKQRGGLVHTYQVKGKSRTLKVYSLKDLRKSPADWKKVAIKVNLSGLMQARTEVIQRLNANACEYCGKEKGYFEVHHVRKLKDVQGEDLWQQIMVAMKRKTLILCVACHDLLHQGTLPDWRYRTG